MRVAFISHSDHFLLHLLDLSVELGDLRLNFLAHGKLPIRSLTQDKVLLLDVLEFLAKRLLLQACHLSPVTLKLLVECVHLHEVRV